MGKIKDSAKVSLDEKSNKKNVSDSIIGSSLKNLKELVTIFSENGNNILLVGPRGVGKELFAKLYLEKSEKEKFIPINCAGISDTNLQSELFGHVKGSFTGAANDRKGILTTYEKNGLIFLDEIGDASQSFQAMLLRVLQTGDYKKYGGDEIINAANICIIAATSNLDAIRDDLKDRFSLLYIPELAVRRKDIPHLIRYFCDNLPVDFISKDAISCLKDHSWPGNVRELKKLLNEAASLCKIRQDNTLRKYDFPSLIQSLEGIEDKTKKERINDLHVNQESLPHDYFFIEIWGSLHPEKVDPVEYTNAHLLSIVGQLNGIRTSIDKLLKPENVKNPSQGQDIEFENTIPGEYKNLFWEYHAKKGRGGTQIEGQFEGRINKKTAWDQLKKAKERLERKQIKSEK